MKIKALNCIDFYKADHRSQYPKGTNLVYSNFTPRSNKYSNVKNSKGVVFFGLQGFIKWYLIDCWNDTFFNRDKEEVIAQYKKRMDTSLGKNAVSMEHIAALHDLGYLPIQIKALPEGVTVPYGVPVLTIKNTLPEFFWLTNYLESVMSAELWKACTSATTAKAYKDEFKRHSMLTGSPEDFIMWQGHDFSFRGMGGVYDSKVSGAGHLLSFCGTDSIPSIDYLEDYYCADANKELTGGSVSATEHSVMSMNLKDTEIKTFENLITKIYPNGVVSIVSDTWDFWRVITDYVPALKDKILNRDGRVVIRPDSGDPVKIICGDKESMIPHIKKGAYEMLWDIFGGTINDKGYKVLDPHIGMIYGDSITLDRQKEILKLLEAKGFTASNLVLGIGSYTYALVTRDTHGFAMKATYGEVNGEGRNIFKDPKTDSGLKKSAKGLLRVDKVNDVYVLKDEVTSEEEKGGALEIVFRNSKLLKEQTLSEIRSRL